MPNAMFQLAQVMSHKPLAEFEDHMLCVVGHLGRDPELRYTPSGIPVLSGSLAVSWGKRDQDQKTEWITWKAWRETGLSLQDRRKGDAVLLIGKVQRDAYTAKDGTVKDSWQLTVYSAAIPIWTKKGNGGPEQKKEPDPPAKDDADVPF